MFIESPNMDQVIDWLMEGDAAIRWQTLRDLLDAPEQEWRAEQQRTLTEGWGAQLLALQDPNGNWGGGIYSPKWISTTYTLLTLCSIGIPPEYTSARQGAQLVLNKLLGERMPDGGWNCRRLRHQPHHSSFHTTINVLEGLRVYVERCGTARREDVLAAEQGALAFMLQHRLYKSDQTGLVINPKFGLLSFPYRWHYDILRGLEYFARVGAPHDNRLQDAVDLLYQRRRKDGCWPVQQKHSGRVFFDMEKTGGASRWNTLRAMRVMRWWESSCSATEMF